MPRFCYSTILLISCQVLSRPFIFQVFSAYQPIRTDSPGKRYSTWQAQRTRLFPSFTFPARIGCIAFAGYPKPRQSLPGSYPDPREYRASVGNNS